MAIGSPAAAMRFSRRRSASAARCLTKILVSNYGNNLEVPTDDLFSNSLSNGWHHIATTYADGGPVAPVPGGS